MDGEDLLGTLKTPRFGGLPGARPRAISIVPSPPSRSRGVGSSRRWSSRFIPGRASAATTARSAFSAYVAPISAAQAAVVGAPPISTRGRDGSPAASTARTSSRCTVIVVVRRAEAATIRACTSRARVTKASTGTSLPRSCTSNPWAERRVPTRLLPMSCRSPRTVPMTTLPRAFQPAGPSFRGPAAAPSLRPSSLQPPAPAPAGSRPLPPTVRRSDERPAA